MEWVKPKALAAGSLLLIVTALSSSGQSFDCAQAATSYEKFICAHRELRDADSKMDAAYKSALAQLSEEGKRRLVESQRSWLRYERNTSKLDVGYWRGIYGIRTKQLENTLQTAGPFKIQSVTMYKAEIAGRSGPHPATGTSAHPATRTPRVSGTSAHHPATRTPRVSGTPAQEQDTPSGETGCQDPGKIQISFPRIESPSTAETERWNRLVQEHLRELSGELECDTERDVSFGITFASQDVISLDVGLLSFSRNSAHPNHAGEGYTVLLKSGRELQASDLFTPTQSWKSFLNGIVFGKLKAQAAKEGWSLNPSSAAELQADEVKRWNITQQGLQIGFVQYEVSNYASGGHSVVVSWAELKPYLKATLPFSIPQP